MLLDRYATYTGSDPRRAPAVLAACRTSSRRFGAWYVRGGLRRLARGRARAGACSAVPSCAPAARVTRGRSSRAAGSAASRLDDGERRARRRRRLRRRRAHALRPICCRRHGRRPAPAAAAATARRRRCPGSCCCSRCAAAPPGSRTTPCCSRDDYDAEFDAVFGRRRRTPVDATRRSTSARPTTRRCVPTTTTRRGSSWSTRPGTAPAAAAVDWDAPGLADGVRRPRARRDGGPRARRARPGAVAGDPDARPTWRATTGAPGGAIYGTSSQRRPRGVPAAGQRLARARAVPGRRIGAPRGRTAAGRTLGRASSPG